MTVPCRNILLHVSIAFATFKALTAKLLLRVGGGGGGGLICAS